MKLDVRLKNNILHCIKIRHCEKLCCERTSQFYISVVVVDLPTDCILSFLFLAETDVLVPVFSQSTDVVLNFVAVLKFPNIWLGLLLLSVMIGRSSFCCSK